MATYHEEYEYRNKRLGYNVYKNKTELVNFYNNLEDAENQARNIIKQGDAYSVQVEAVYKPGSFERVKVKKYGF